MAAFPHQTVREKAKEKDRNVLKRVKDACRASVENLFE